MTRTELLAVAARGELFSAEEVQGILEGRKTRAMRLIKPKYSNTHIEWFKNKYGKRLVEIQNDIEGETFGQNEDGTSWHKVLWCDELRPRHKVGDIIYVRETWTEFHDGYFYRAGFDDCLLPIMEAQDAKWRPSIHMPRAAARIFLRITDVKVQRPQEMDVASCVREGITWENYPNAWTVCAKPAFIKLWDNLNAKRGYEYKANPLCWVYEFERVAPEERG